MLRSASEEVSERAQGDVQVLLREAEVLPQLLHPLFERHQRLAEPLDLLVAQSSGFHSPDRLALHELPQELDEREHKLGQAPRHVLTILGLDPHRPGSVEKLYGGQGPVTTT